MSVFRGTCYATNSLVYSVDTSSHEQTGKIIIFAQFEEVNLVENGHNTEEYEPFLSQLMRHLHIMTLMTDISVQTLSRTFGKEVKYIHNLKQDTLD